MRSPRLLPRTMSAKGSTLKRTHRPVWLPAMHADSRQVFYLSFGEI